MPVARTAYESVDGPGPAGDVCRLIRRGSIAQRQRRDGEAEPQGSAGAVEQVSPLGCFRGCGAATCRSRSFPVLNPGDDRELHARNRGDDHRSERVR